MAHNTPVPHSVEEHPELHEHSDVPTRPLVVFGVAMIVFAVVIHIGLYFLFEVYNRAEENRDKLRVRSAVPRSREEKLPAEPRLQGIPTFHANTGRVDTDQMRVENQRLVNSYGRTEDANFARIPVSRAIDLALQRGFPTTAPSTRPKEGK